MTLRFLASIRRCVLLMLLVGAHHAAAQEISWQYVDGLYGGNVLSIQRAPNGRLFALLDTRLYMSLDNGASWIEACRGREFLSMAIDPQGRLFARVKISLGPGRVLRSTNNGIEWNIVPGVYSSVRTMAIDPISGELIVASNSLGVMSSNDAGESWQTLDTRLNVSQLVVDSSGTIHAVAGNELWRADRASRTHWELEWRGPSTITALAIDGHGQPIVAVDSIYRYDSSSRTWWTSSLEFSNGSPITSIIARSASDLFAIDSRGRLYSSVDGGSRWDPRGNSTGIMTIHFPTVEKMVVGMGSGVWQSNDDGETWSLSSKGMIAYSIEAIRYGAGGEVFVMGSGTGLHRSTDNGETWESMPFQARDIVRSSQGELLAVGVRMNNETSLYVSGDDGAHWDTIALALPSDVFPQRIICRGNIVFVVADSGPFSPARAYALLRSTDGGVNWSSPIADTILRQVRAVDLAVDSTGRFYAVGGGRIAFSDDSGTTWKKLEGLGRASWSGIPLMSHVSAASDSVIIVAEDDLGTIHYSTDQGVNWMRPFNRVHSFTGPFAVDRWRHIVGLVKEGVAISSDNCESWQFANRGLPDSSAITTLGVDHEGNVLVGTNGYGLYRMRAPSASVESDVAASAMLHARMDGNHLVTTIVSPRETHGEIALYDMLGRRVTVLASDDVVSGEYAFDISTLPSGSYFVRGRFDDDVVSLPIMITR